MKTWLAGIVMFAALAAAAQADIVAGTVIDRGTNQPIANANVTVTFASGAKPLHTKTDAAGRFTVETTETPAYVTLISARYETFTMSIAAVAPSAIADLHIWLNTRLTPMKDDLVRRTWCEAFQPSRPWDFYSLMPGRCGMPKF
jgi:hypothetical protein